MSRSQPSDDTPPSEPSSSSVPPRGTSADGAGPDVAEQLATAKKEAADVLDRYLRAVADLENFRRRSAKDKEELRLFAASRVLEDLLPVLDNLNLGLATARQHKADLKTLIGGVDIVAQQLKSVMASHGLKEINPAGKLFDPHQHEALSHEPSADVPEEHVVTVVRTGYSLHGRLLRAAAVVVSSGPAKKQG